jgi:hypothetical protein
MYIVSGLRISIREENRHEETSFMQPATPSASRYYDPNWMLSASSRSCWCFFTTPCPQQRIPALPTS